MAKKSRLEREQEKRAREAEKRLENLSHDELASIMQGLDVPSEPLDPREPPETELEPEEEAGEPDTQQPETESDDDATGDPPQTQRQRRRREPVSQTVSRTDGLAILQQQQDGSSSSDENPVEQLLEVLNAIKFELEQLPNRIYDRFVEDD